MNELDEKGKQVFWLSGLGSVLAVKGMEQEKPELLIAGTVLLMTGLSLALQVVEQVKEEERHGRN